MEIRQFGKLMFIESLRITAVAVAQSLALAALGFFLYKKNVLSGEGYSALSRLVVLVTLPLLIFSQLVQEFKFDLYPKWWVFPLISIAITALGLGIGYLLSLFVPGKQHKLQFVSLVGFQNSGYLPLALAASLLPAQLAGTMFIYIFLFLLGFNLLVWSVGLYLLNFSETRKFQFMTLFSPPVIATILGLAVVFFGLDRFMVKSFLLPLRSIGDCTLPLAMLVVGAGLAQIKLRHIDNKSMVLMSLGKLVILPLVGFLLVLKLNLPEIMGLLIIMQLAMPPATSLSVIIEHCKKEDLLISQGVLLGHIFSIISIPVFLSLYLARFIK